MGEPVRAAVDPFDDPSGHAPSAGDIRRTLEAAGDVIVRQSSDRIIQHVSPSVTALLGWAPREMVGRPTADFLHPADDEPTGVARERLRAGFPARARGRVLCKDGSHRWIEVIGLLTSDAGDGAGGSIAVLRDIDLQMRADSALAESEAHYRLMADHAIDVVFQSDPSHRVTWVSSNVHRSLGWTPQEVLGTRLADLVHPDDLGAAKQISLLLNAESTPLNTTSAFTLRFRAKAGPFAWMAGTSTVVADATSGLRHIITGLRDIDELVHERDRAAAHEATLLQAEQRYRLLAENAMDLVFSMDMRAVIQWVSPSVGDMLGYRPEELVGRFSGLLIHLDDMPLMLEASTRARAGEAASCRLRMLTRAGGTRWVEATPRPIHDASGTLIGGVVGVRDIHDEVAAREALDHAVDFDGLTGLAKRTLALNRIQDILDVRREPGWALLCLGIDGMTAINQAYSYTVGDEVLKVVADRLVASAGAADRVARIAGDEFVVLMRDVVTATDAANAAVRILDAVRGPLDLGETSIDITGCIGIALSHSVDASDLLRDAIAAMRRAASKGSDRWEILDGDVGQETRRSLTVQKALREALVADRIRPWFMPIVDLSEGTIVGYEALARWVQDDGTVLAPAGFTEIAERTGLILSIDRTILTQSLDAMDMLPADQHIAVNVSASSLASGTLAEWVTRELDRTGVDPARLQLEVTETALFQVTDSIRLTMRMIADLGVSWWVDDFGTGFSSISHLRDLPIAGLKLDQTFTSGVTVEDSHHSRLAQGLAGLAIGLSLRTVAEGIETAMQADILAAQGWQMGQGWLYGKATPQMRGY